MADVTIVPGKVIFLGVSTIVPSVVTPPDNKGTIVLVDLSDSTLPSAETDLFSPPATAPEDIRLGIPGQQTVYVAGVVNPIPNISQPQNKSPLVSFSNASPIGPSAGDLSYTVVNDLGQTVLVDVNGNPVPPYAQVSIGQTVNVNGSPP